ncbi:MAG TPA: hypothetical protein VGO09_04345 [Flavisolibacter sp.]|jgi:hypothetical protein|nr:hypothetical protein [Flavisolibacter sp.]
MKKLFPAFVLIALMISCKKSTITEPQQNAVKLVSTSAFSANVIASADTFIYSSNGNLLSQKIWTYSNGVNNGDTVTLTFNYTGTNPDPATYTIKNGRGINTYTLTYDNQGRLIKDTLIPDVLAIASTFSYPGNNIVFNSVDNGSTDTIYLSNNNIVKTVQASIPPDPASNTVDVFSYDHLYPNPFYSAGQTQNVRLLLTKIDGWNLVRNDFISQNAFTAVNENNSFNIPVTYTLDASGKIIKGTAFSFSMVYNYK